MNYSKKYLTKSIHSKIINILLVFLIFSFYLIYFYNPSTILANKITKIDVSIDKVILAENKLNTGETQLIEVILTNKTDQDILGIAKLKILLPNGQSIFHGEKKVTIFNTSQKSILFPYPIGPLNGGKYEIHAYFYDKTGEKILVRSIEKITFEAKGPLMPRFIDPSTNQDSSKAGNKKNVFFENPDLVWLKSAFLYTNILRGESATVQLVLNNNGGNIAKNVEYSVYWYYVKQGSKRKKRIYQGKIDYFAPGEKKVFDIPITLPQNELRGTYKIIAIVDPVDRIKELNEQNNSIETENELSFQDIALEFPPNKHSFQETGLFIYKWRSRKYHQFKVQFSSDPNFLQEFTEELPKDIPTAMYEIQGTGSEVPTLGKALMKEKKIDYLYWRVFAADGNTHSEVRTFFIDLKPN